MDHLDKNRQCALVHAALRGHMEVVKFLIQCDWAVRQQQQSPQGQQQAALTKSQAVQQALIAAASMGYTEVQQGALALSLSLAPTSALTLTLTSLLLLNYTTAASTLVLFCF